MIKRTNLYNTMRRGKHNNCGTVKSSLTFFRIFHNIYFSYFIYNVLLRGFYFTIFLLIRDINVLILSSKIIIFKKKYKVVKNTKKWSSMLQTS